MKEKPNGLQLLVISTEPTSNARINRDALVGSLSSLCEGVQ